VCIQHRRLTGRDQGVLGDHLTGAGDYDEQPPVVGARTPTDSRSAESAPSSGPHTRQPVDLAHHHWPQRRQYREQLPLARQTLGRHRADLTMHRGVHL